MESSYLPGPTQVWSFITLLSDVLRVPEDTIGTAFLLFNRFGATVSASPTAKPSGKHRSSTEPPVDGHVGSVALSIGMANHLNNTTDVKALALATLSLATKATEAHRTPRDIILTAWRILHSHEPSATPLTVPSERFDNMLASFMDAEMLVFRALNHDLLPETPFDHFPRYLERAMLMFNQGEGGWLGAEDYDTWDLEQAAEYRVVHLLGTRLGRACQSKALEACKNYWLANDFEPRVLAAAALYSAIRAQGLSFFGEVESWLSYVAKDEVAVHDFEQAMELLDPNSG